MPNVGTARKNENSAAALRERPKNKPPIIVDPERDMPGINATACASPSLKASMGRMSSTVSIVTVCLRFSAHKIMKAPIIKAVATGIGLKR